MIKLLNILSEIRIIGKNHFPKDKEWVYKVTTKEQGIKLYQKLKELGYTWAGGNEIDASLNGEGSGNTVLNDDLTNLPLYISRINDRGGITWSRNDSNDFFTTPNPIKINF